MDPDSAIARQMKDTIRQSEAIRNAWVDAVSDSVVNFRMQDGQKNDAQEGATLDGVKFSKRTLSDQIDEVANKTFDTNNHVNYGSTPKALANILSLPVLPMLGTYTHAYTMALSKQKAYSEGRRVKGLNFHDLGWDTVKSIPDLLNKPAAIIKSNSDIYDSRFVVVTYAIDNSKNPIIAAIAAKGSGKYLGLDLMDTAFLSSYGKEKIKNYIATAKTENRILWIDKNNHRKQDSPGVQFSDAILSGDYSKNLAQFKQIVKREFSGTVFANTFDSDGNRLFSSRSNQDSTYLELAREPEKNKDQLAQMVEQAAKDAGYTKLFYHGSKKGGGFTMFRDWQYFTENKEYAKRYTERGKEKSLYTTYVKMENPFDTRIPEVRGLFEQARMEYGMGALQENGLPDWTDGYDIADFIDENDLPYDSIILDEGGDMVNGEPVSRGLSYVIRKSNQVKLADAVTYDDSGEIIPLSQRFDAGQKDIRYSSRTRQDSQIDRLTAQNEKLQQEADYLRQLVQIQKSGNKDFILDRNSVKKQAGKLMASANANGDTGEFSRMLNDFYHRMHTDSEITWDAMQEDAGAIADTVDVDMPDRLADIVRWANSSKEEKKETHPTILKVGCVSLAERVGFEPTVRCRITSFQDWLLKPLGHLSIGIHDSILHLESQG